MLSGFKKFIMQGNVIDLAVGVVIGAAFGALVTQFTASFIDPLIKLISGGGVDAGVFTINDVVFDYSAFINAIITFLLTAAAIYFVVVVPVNRMKERRAQAGIIDDPSNDEKIIALLQEIAAK